MLKLTIVKYEDRPKEEIDQEIQRMGSMYNNRNSNFEEVRRQNAVGVMEIMVTEEQFEAIRKAVLTNF